MFKTLYGIPILFFLAPEPLNTADRYLANNKKQRIDFQDLAF